MRVIHKILQGCVVVCRNSEAGRDHERTDVSSEGWEDELRTRKVGQAVLVESNLTGIRAKSLTG